MLRDFHIESPLDGLLKREDYDSPEFDDICAASLMQLMHDQCFPGEGDLSPLSYLSVFRIGLFDSHCLLLLVRPSL